MTYAKLLSPSAEQIIEPFAPAIMALEEGSSLLLQDTSPKGLRQLRDAIYTWLHTNNIKHFYRVSSETPTKLRILRRHRSSAHIVEDRPFNEIETFVMDNLLEITSIEEATELIKQAVIAKTIDKDLIPAIIREWKRVQGEG